MWGAERAMYSLTGWYWCFRILQIRDHFGIGAAPTPRALKLVRNFVRVLYTATQIMYTKCHSNRSTYFVEGAPENRRFVSRVILLPAVNICRRQMGNSHILSYSGSHRDVQYVYVAFSFA